MPRLLLMLTMVIMGLVMVDTIVHIATDTDTIAHTVTDTGEERRGMLMLSQPLPLTQMPRLTLMLTMVIMGLVMVTVDTIGHTA